MATTYPELQGKTSGAEHDTELSGAQPDFEEKYSRGEAVAQEGNYGPRNERIPDKYQKIFEKLADGIAHRDMFARIDEVKRTADGDFYWRNVFDAVHNDANGVWEWGGGPGLGAATGQTDSGNTNLNYPLNLYQAKGRSFVKMIGHKPDVHFTASGEAPTSFRVSAAANQMKKRVEQINDMEQLAQQTAKEFYTGGRVGLYTRWVTDGSRFGYYDQDYVDEVPEGVGEGGDPPKKTPRIPKGGEVITCHGVLELKVPVNMRDIHQFPWIQLSREVDIASAKAMYPSIAGQIRSGEPGPGEFMFDRTTRIAITQGLHLISQMAESYDQLPTMQTTWFRPCMWSEIEDEDCREWFQDNYPDGAKVVFMGSCYAESCNESMDDHWTICYPIVGDGQTTPAYGFSMLTAQDLWMDVLDLEAEMHFKAIPAWYGNPSIFDFSARTKTRAVPGAAYPLKHDLPDGINVQQAMVQEPTVQVNSALINLRDSLLGTISDIITGISAPAIGQSDENNTTLGGISLLRAASRGETGTAFTSFAKAYARSMEQAVRIGAYYRIAESEEGIISIPQENSADAMIDLADLREGNYWCEQDIDQSYPSTFEEKQTSLIALVMAAAQGSKLAQATIDDPNNAPALVPLFGIPGINSDNQNVKIKTMADIEQLLNEDPKPNLQAMQQFQQQFQLASAAAMLTGKPAPEIPDSVKYQLFTCSMELSPMDDNAGQLAVTKQWINSPTGQRTRVDNPPGFLNVELYAMANQQKVQAAAQQAMQMQAAPALMIEKAKHQPKNPAESIAFKDLGPQGKLQLAAQAGIDVRGDMAADMAEDSLTPPQPRKLRR